MCGHWEGVSLDVGALLNRPISPSPSPNRCLLSPSLHFLSIVKSEYSLDIPRHRLLSSRYLCWVRLKIRLNIRSSEHFHFLSMEGLEIRASEDTDIVGGTLKSWFG